MQKRKLKIGVVGVANIALRSVIPAIITSTHCELYGIASRDLDNAKVVADMYDIKPYSYRDLLRDENIDAVYLPLPTGLHEYWVSEALKYNKHLLVEKSFASDFKSAAKMVDLAKSGKLLVMENYMFLHHSQHQAVDHVLNQGTIGEVRLFRGTFCFPPLAKDNFRYDKSLGGGALLDAAGYTIMAARRFLGDDVKVEGAYLTNFGQEVDMMGSVILSNKKSQMAQLFFGFDNYYQCNYEIFGSKGKIQASRAYTPPSDYKPLMLVETAEGVVEHALKPDNHFLNIVNSFCETVASGEFDGQYADILTQAKIIDSIREKAEYVK
jgi:dTDP-3,4-didehydro-2,6-dideoxy-alpha-D-glucose 3-reductase